jgi:protein phosphatase
MLLIGELLLRNGKMSKHFDTSDSDRFMIAVADGMGGHNCGEVASADTLKNLQFYFGDLPTSLRTSAFNEAICEWLKSINNIIVSKGHIDTIYQGMGTTLVALAYYCGQYYWMNCGDSRLCRLHDGELTQLTTDHSLSNLLGKNEKTNIITNCIGGGCKTSYLDIVQCTDQVVEGDTLLLCSDGLTDMISNKEICQLLTEGFDADALCQAAEDAGGYDNISAIVIRVA